MATCEYSGHPLEYPAKGRQTVEWAPAVFSGIKVRRLLSYSLSYNQDRRGAGDSGCELQRWEVGEIG